LTKVYIWYILDKSDNTDTEQSREYRRAQMKTTQTQTQSLEMSAEYEQILQKATRYLTQHADSWISDIHDEEMNVYTSPVSSVARLLMEELERMSWYSETLGEDLWDTAQDLVKEYRSNTAQ
jgi:ribosome-binding ATPase YchF (GTP1/OBG family)